MWNELYLYCHSNFTTIWLPLNSRSGTHMQNLLTEANLLAQTIAKHFKPERIILFGSAARGDYTADSDIDLLIIKKSNKKKAYRIKEIFESVRAVPRTYPLDPIVYTPDEIKERLSLGDYFIKRIMAEGKTLYG